MASVQELLDAAVRADSAGDADAARTLVGLARQHMPSQNADGVPRADSQLPLAKPRPDRFGDTISAVTEGPIEATKFYANRTMEPGRTPLQRVGDAGMTALSGLGTGYALAAGTVGEIAGGSPDNEKRLARDLMMMGQVALPEMAGVSSVARAAGSVPKAAPRAPSPAQRGAQAASDLGVTPSLGMTSKTGAMTAAALEKVPGSGGVIARDIERAVSEVEGAFKRTVEKLGDARSTAGAGDVLQSGLVEFRDRFKARAGEMFRGVGEHIPDGTPVQIPNTLEAAAEARKWFARNPELARRLGLNEWDGVLSEAAENGLSWRALSDFRSEVGGAVGSIKGALADQSDARLKRLYATLTEDMEAAAKAAGPEAEHAWKRATAYYRKGAERISKSLDQTITAKSPERAFDAFSRALAEGRSSSDIQRVRDIRASMSRDDWNDVAASIVDRMGRSKPGQQNAAGDAFSPASFLTEWNKMDPQAKRVLLPESVRTELDKLAEVSERAKAAGSERNFSNTGTVVTAAGAGGALAYAPVTVAAVLGGAHISSRFLTNPGTLRALNSAARGKTKPLEQYASGRGAFARDAETILRLMAAESALSTQPQRAVNQ